MEGSGPPCMLQKSLVSSTDDSEYALILLSEPARVMLVIRQKYAVFKHWDECRESRERFGLV